jgi:hypothetical protein
MPVAVPLSGATTVRARDDLEIVAVRVVPVQTAATIVVVDLERPLMHRIGPVGEPTRFDALENDIELRFAHEKRVVLYGEGLSGVLEIEGHAVIESHSPERTEPRGRIAAQDPGEPRCGRFRIACRYDGVIELDSHYCNFDLDFTGDRD